MKISHTNINLENIFDNSQNDLRYSSNHSDKDLSMNMKSANAQSSNPTSDILSKLDKLEQLSGRRFSELEKSSVQKFIDVKNSNIDEINSKWDTVNIAVKKEIPLTQKNLNALHQTLNKEQNTQEILETISEHENIDKSNLSDEQKLKEILERYKEYKKNNPYKGDKATASALKQSSKTASGYDLAKQIAEVTGLEVYKKGKIIFIKSDDGNFRGIDIRELSAMLENSIKSDESIENLIQIKFNQQIALSENIDIFNINLNKNNLQYKQSDMDKIKLSSENISEENIFDKLNKNSSNQLNNSLEFSVNTENKDVDYHLQNQQENQFYGELIEEFINEINNRLEESINGVISMLENNPFISNNQSDELLLDSNFRTFLKTEITEQAYHAREYFEKNRTDIIKNLEIHINDYAQNKSNSNETANLARVIDKLDSLITSNEMSMYLDMKTERNCLKMSSDLQIARNHLEMGRKNEALKIIKQAKSMLEDIKFMPDEKSIELRAYHRGLTALGVPLTSALLQTNKLNSASQVLSYFKNMGINYEAELTKKILENTGDLKQDNNNLKDNIKAILISIKKETEHNNHKVSEVIDSQLSNLNGQQLFNKLESAKDIQNLFFHVPINANDEIKDMQLYVQGRKKGDKLDWQNCSLYFSIDLRKYGHTGIHLIIQERNININVKNDNPTTVDFMMPAIQKMKDLFSEVGFSWGNIKFSSYDNNKIKKQFEIPNLDNINERKILNSNKSVKGFDLSL